MVKYFESLFFLDCILWYLLGWDSGLVLSSVIAPELLFLQSFCFLW